MSHGKPGWKHVIGIVGGLGPHAHVEFESLLLEATGKALGRPPRDQDYPSWVVSSIPSTPDRTRALLEGAESPVEAILESASRLSPASFAVIPCNTAHAFLEEVRLRAALPFLDMIQVTAGRALSQVGTRGVIGLLAATGTLKAEVYQKAIRAAGPQAGIVSPLDLPNGEELQERLVMEPVFGPRRAGGGIKSGAFRDPGKREELAEPLRDAARRLAAAGASVVLTACTEIPLVLGRDSLGSIPLLDPMAVAAEEAIEIALGRRPLPVESPAFLD
jgi:aspartate racemase